MDSSRSRLARGAGVSLAPARRLLGTNSISAPPGDLTAGSRRCCMRALAGPRGVAQSTSALPFARERSSGKTRAARRSRPVSVRCIGRSGQSSGQRGEGVGRFARVGSGKRPASPLCGECGLTLVVEVKFVERRVAAVRGEVDGRVARAVVEEGVGIQRREPQESIGRTSVQTAARNGRSPSASAPRRAVGRCARTRARWSA